MIKILLILGICSAPIAIAAPERLSGPYFSLEIDRDTSTIVPNHDLVGFSIIMKPGVDGKVEPETLRIKLLAPATGAFVSTDFPHIEGSTLVANTVTVPAGVFSWQQVLPIRGNYRLDVTAETSDGQAREHSFEFRVPENPAKKTTLTYFLLGLGAFAAMSGWVLARGRRQKLRAAYGLSGILNVLLLMAALAVSQSTKVFAHGSDHAAPELKTESVSARDGEQLKLEILTAKPRVGELAMITGALYNQAGDLQPARFSLSIMQLEHQQNVFQTEITASNGSFEWQQQLYDGSPHRVTLKAWPLNASAESSPSMQSIETEVEARQPPWQATWKAFALLMVFATLCLGLGFLAGFGRIPKEAVAS